MYSEWKCYRAKRASPVITSANSTNLTCFGSDNGTISVTANGGSGILQYSINGGSSFQTSGNFANLAIGNFNIVVQDTNNCVASSATNIIQPPLVTVSSS